MKQKRYPDTCRIFKAGEFWKSQPKLYHGTYKDFETFDITKQRLPGSEQENIGFFFTTSRTGAQKYADFAAWDTTHRIGEKGFVKEVILNIKKPAIIQATEEDISSLSKKTLDKIIKIKQEGKNDAVIIKGSGEAGTGFDKPDIYLVFDENNILTKPQFT